jgi:hypothetical protein
MMKQPKDIIDSIIEVAAKSGKPLNAVRRYLMIKYKMCVEESVLFSRLKRMKK